MNNCSNSSQQRVVCEVRYRTFSRESDKKRHKCTNERLKPVSQQMGAVQCTNCNRWFHSKGGLSVHPGHAYFVSSFVPKFWGCVTILIRQQYNRTGQVCVHIYVCLRERVHPSAWEFITNPVCMCVCVCVCTHAHAQSSLMLLCSISVGS